LDPAGLVQMVTTLRELEHQAAAVQTEDALLAVADAFCRLVKEMPQLRAMVILEEVDVPAAGRRRRRITPDSNRDAFNKNRYVQAKNQYVQAQAAQIRNAMVACRQKLEQRLPRLHELSSDNAESNHDD